MEVSGMNKTKKELEELESIRKLTMLLLLKLGATQDEVAAALGVTSQRASQIVPKRKLKPVRIDCRCVD
jgi:DNA-directed RNA polymerase specialized sigma subunit